MITYIREKNDNEMIEILDNHVFQVGMKIILGKIHGTVGNVTYRIMQSGRAASLQQIVTYVKED